MKSNFQRCENEQLAMSFSSCFISSPRRHNFVVYSKRRRFQLKEIDLSTNFTLNIIKKLCCLKSERARLLVSRYTAKKRNTTIHCKVVGRQMTFCSIKYVCMCVSCCELFVCFEYDKSVFFLILSFRFFSFLLAAVYPFT